MRRKYDLRVYKAGKTEISKHSEVAGKVRGYAKIHFMCSLHVDLPVLAVSRV